MEGDFVFPLLFYIGGIMKLYYDIIEVRKRKLINAGVIEIANTGINLLKGKNGVGKTLVLKNIFFNCKQNAVLVDQDNNEIIPELSIIENIIMNDDEKSKTEIVEILKRYNLDYLLKLNSRKLSGGEKRIISILRGILSNASLILIDEPTNDLDYSMVEKLVKIIINYSMTKSFLIITHDDRLNAVANRTFSIENQAIILNETRESAEIFSSEDNYSEIISKYDNSILISKIFKRKYFSAILILLLCIVSIVTIQDIKKIEKDKIKNIRSGQVDFFIPLSEIGTSLVTNGAYPVGVLKSLNNNDSIFRKIKSINKEFEMQNINSINFGLKLADNENYNVYPLEYYNPDQREHFFTLNVYSSDILGVKESTWVDTPFVLTQDYLDENRVKYPFDQVVFEKSVAVLESKKTKSEKNLEILYMSVLLKNGYDFYDFIQQNDVKELLTGNFYIRSNETIKLTNQIASFTGYRRTLMMIILASILIIIIDAFYTYLYIFVRSKTISIFKNYGLEKENLKNIVLNKYNDKYLRLFFTITFLLYNFLFMLGKESGKLFGNYIIAISFIFTVCTSYRINKKIIINKINKIYNWRHR